MSTTVQTIVTQAFFDLGATASGAAPSDAESADGLLRLNQMLASWSAEGDTVFNQVMQSFNLTAGTSSYTLGASGTFATTGGLRPHKVTSWRATFGDMMKGGPVLALDEFGAAASAYQAQLAELAIKAALEGLVSTVASPLSVPIPSLVGADTAYPLINIRVAPVPSNAGGAIELAYWTGITAFSSLNDTVTLPPEFEDALHFNLAVRLSPQYSRASGLDPALAANAQNTKAAIVQQNRMLRQQQPQQQGQ